MSWGLNWEGRDGCSRSRSESAAKEHCNSQSLSPGTRKRCFVCGVVCARHNPTFSALGVPPSLLEGRIPLVPTCCHSLPGRCFVRGPPPPLDRAPATSVCSLPPPAPSLLLVPTPGLLCNCEFQTISLHCETKTDQVASRLI